MEESPTGSTASHPPAESRRLRIRLLSAADTLAGVSLLAVYLAKNWSHVRASYSMPPGPIAAMALMMIGIFGLRAAAYSVIFRSVVGTVRYGEWCEVVAAGALHASTLLLAAGKLYLAFSLGPERVPFAACLVFSAAGIATRLVTVTPGALGVRELLIGALAQLTGFELRDALIASTIDRVVEVAVTCVVGGVASFRLTRRL